MLAFSVAGVVLVSIRVPPANGSIGGTDRVSLAPRTHLINLGTLSTLDTASTVLTSPQISTTHQSLITYKAPIHDTVAIARPFTHVSDCIHSFHTPSVSDRNNKDVPYPPASAALDHDDPFEMPLAVTEPSPLCIPMFPETFIVKLPAMPSTPVRHIKSGVQTHKTPNKVSFSLTSLSLVHTD